MPNYSGNFSQVARRENAFGLPIGSVTQWAAVLGSTLPPGYLICDGAPVSRTTYPLLFAVIGTGHGDGTKNANGSASIYGPGTGFNLPDYRARFLRGLANMNGPSGASSGRDQGPRSAQNVGGTASGTGSIESDSLQGHWHQVWSLYRLSGNGSAALAPGSPTGNSSAIAKELVDDGVNGTPRTGPETRPKNSSALYIIRAY